MKTFTLEEIEDEFIGEKNTPERIKYEQKLQLELIGQYIKSVRKEKKLTQTELGNICGMKKQQVVKIENNYNSCNVKTLMKVLDALDIKLMFVKNETV